MAPCAGLNCCRWCCCVVIVFVNVLSIIVGILLAILGAILLWGYAVFQNLTGSYMASINESFKSIFGAEFDFQSYYGSLVNLTGSVAGVLIGFGLILIIVSCIGCLGACIGNPACLIIYMVCVGLLLIGQLIVVIIWFSDSTLLRRSVRQTLDNQVDKFNGEKSANFESVTLNLIQSFAGCCGVVNGSDFGRSKNWNRTYTMIDSRNNTHSFNLTYPVSCCKFNITSFTLVDQYCPYNGTKDTSNYNIGCYNQVFSLVENYLQLNNFFYALAGLLGLELLLIIGAVLVYCAKRQELKPGGSEAQYKMHQMT